MSAVLVSDKNEADTAQSKFDRKYITSGEVRERLRVTRVAIHIRVKAGLLPDAITIQPNLLTIWERDVIEPHLVQWQEHITRKRSAMG